MGKAALKVVETRRDIADRLLTLHVKHAALFAEIDDLKEKLRKAAEAAGAGFTEEFGEGQKIAVTKASESKYKGTMPTLDPAGYLKLDEKERQGLIRSKVVVLKDLYTEARRPSVTVKV